VCVCVCVCVCDSDSIREQAREFLDGDSFGHCFCTYKFGIHPRSASSRPALFTPVHAARDCVATETSDAWPWGALHVSSGGLHVFVCTVSTSCTGGIRISLVCRCVGLVCLDSAIDDGV
jgi:hypothetical protein